MTTQTEALKLALEALEEVPVEYDSHGNPMDKVFDTLLNKAIAAIKEALAAPQGEPCTNDEWLANATQGARDFAAKVKKEMS